MILNSRIFDFHPNVILVSLPAAVTHLRGYRADFKKPKVDGLYQNADQDKIENWISFVKTNGLKVVWTPFMTKDRTLSEEIAFIQYLIDQGVEITHFEMGGEFYLPKYYYNQQHKKGVVEQVRIADYESMLDEWIPAFQSHFPQVKIMLMTASHQNGTSDAEVYRKDWTQACMDYKTANDAQNEWGFAFHYYAGAKPDAQPSNGEEAIYENIDFSPFFDQVRNAFPNVEIIMPEGGWYRGDDSPEQFQKMSEFYEIGAAAIGEYGIMGLHLLQGTGGSHAWFYPDGITPVGEYFINEYFPSVSPPEPPEEMPVLVNVVPRGKKDQFIIWGKMKLYFSDGSSYKITIWFNCYPFGEEDLGKTKDQILTEYNLWKK